jgi:hypothetical protein
MDPTGNVHQIVCKSQKKWDGHSGNDSADILAGKHELYTERPNSPRPKNGETSEKQSQEHAHHFL